MYAVGNTRLVLVGVVKIMYGAFSNDKMKYSFISAVVITPMLMRIVFFYEYCSIMIIHAMPLYRVRAPASSRMIYHCDIICILVMPKKVKTNRLDNRF
ncbi:hypothetical protein T03_12278 [Trichinella britovi]|uniref:Uncharacterized protein n=1 Tax=Trichinella britovi TaxID=45882 RepID=A0A0V1CR11_TRIBR|nr:hypothetical protein T03_12278 [Trichinella britovi]